MKFLILFFCVSVTTADYWQDRADLLKNEESQYFGHKINLTPKEEAVNKILMAYKAKELENGFAHPESFPPAIHFFFAKEAINKSPVYKFIQKMPKGGALHIHDTSLTSVDYVLKNITYRDHLLYCNNEEGERLVFADPPPQDDCWVPLKTLRENASSVEEFDDWLRGKLSMITDKPYETYPDINTVWKKFQGIFDFHTPMITYREAFIDYYYETLREFREDNVNYMEVRGTLPLVYDLNGWPLNPIQVLGLLKQVSDQFMEDYPDFLGVKYIYAPQRNVKEETIYEYLEIYLMMKELYPDFLIGFDLVGQEDMGKPLTEFINILQEYSHDIKFFFHAGETNWNGLSTDLNLIDAILLNTTRIGHGFAILKHPSVMAEAKRRNVAVEVCPISHQVLGLIKDLRNHPASLLLTEDFPLVISSDNPVFWGAAPLSDDYYEAFMGVASAQADLKMLKQLALNSLVYSGMDAEEKGRVISRFYGVWDKFIDDLYVNGF